MENSSSLPDSSPSDLPRVPDDPLVRSRYRGCLLGGAVGDALGAPVEFMSEDQIRSAFGDSGIRDYAEAHGRLGAITDDTQMTLFTAEGILRGHVRMRMKGLCIPYAVVSHAYLRWLKTQGEEPRRSIDLGMDGWLVTHPELFSSRAPGKTCISSLKNMKRFGIRTINNSKGCGGVMRVAPVGMFQETAMRNRGSEKELLEETFALAADCAAITHGHPTGQLTAGVLAVIIALLLRGKKLDEAIGKSLIPLGRRTGYEETFRAIGRAQDLADDNPGSAEALTALGQGWVAEEAMAMSLYCALSAEDFAPAHFLQSLIVLP